MSGKRKRLDDVEILDNAVSGASVKVENSKEPGNTSSQSGELPREAAEERQYGSQFSAEYTHLYQVLCGGFTAVHSSLYFMNRSMYQVAESMVEYTENINSYFSRMLSVQKEILRAAEKANHSLHRAVYLLHDIRDKQEQQIDDSSNATRRMERHASQQSNDDGEHRKERKREHRSRSGDCYTRHYRKDSRK